MQVMGPNVKKLVIERMSQLAIPSGGGFKDGVDALLTKDKLLDIARESQQWVDAKLAEVKGCADNPYKDDEEIAGAILAKIKEARAKR